MDVLCVLCQMGIAVAILAACYLGFSLISERPLATNGSRKEGGVR